jgi:hypothetical protein
MITRICGAGRGEHSAKAVSAQGRSGHMNTQLRRNNRLVFLAKRVAGNIVRFIR